MKVNIGNYINWIGPYQIADAAFFWCDKYPDEEKKKRWDYKAHQKLGEFLAHGFEKETEDQKRALFASRHKTWFYKLLEWIHDKRHRKVDIKIDYWDSWSADRTLSLIALPLLKQLREKKHGAPYTADEDVPEGLGLRSTEAPKPENEWDTDENHFKRFDWILDEIIWAHEQIVDGDWEDQYSTGEYDWALEFDATRPGYSILKEGPKHTLVTDYDAIKKHQDRINNGLRLFGKYYQHLWD